MPEKLVKKRGRPKGFEALASEIRARTKDGKELVDFAFRVMRGEELEDRLSNSGVVQLPPPMSVRLDAHGWLSDHGFGKPMQAVELTGAEGGPLRVNINIGLKADGN